MNIGGVEKSLLSLLAVIPRHKYTITILVLEKKGGFLKDVPDWVEIKEASWYRKIKPIIMQPPQQTLKDYYNDNQYKQCLSFFFVYFISKYFNSRYLYYKHICKHVPVHLKEYDLAISYQGPTDIIDYYIAHKVTASKKISWVHFDVSKHVINERLYMKLYKMFDKIFVVSKAAQKKLIAKIPSVKNKTELFPNIVSKHQINEMAKEAISFDDDFQGIKIVTVGRLSKEKGQDLAIKVLSKLRKGGYDIRWYCIGDGKQKEAYEQLIEEYGLRNDFILLGARANPFPFIAKADFYVQPSRHEGFCLTLAEAKCLNKSVIATDFIGAFEQIIDGHNGWIVPFDKQALYKKIKYLIENPKEDEQVAKNLSKMEWDTSVETQKLLDYVG